MWYKTLDTSPSHFFSKFYKSRCLELFYFHRLPEMTWRIFSDQEWCLLRKFSLEYWLCFNFSISASLPEISYYHLSKFNTRRLKSHFICSTRKVQSLLRNCRINILLAKNKSWQLKVPIMDFVLLILTFGIFPTFVLLLGFFSTFPTFCHLFLLLGFNFQTHSNF